MPVLVEIDWNGEDFAGTYGAAAAVGEDTFERVVSNGWGTADTGQAWTTSGGTTSDYSVG